MISENICYTPGLGLLLAVTPFCSVEPQPAILSPQGSNAIGSTPPSRPKPDGQTDFSLMVTVALVSDFQIPFLGPLELV